MLGVALMDTKGQHCSRGVYSIERDVNLRRDAISCREALGKRQTGSRGNICLFRRENKRGKAEVCPAKDGGYVVGG